MELMIILLGVSTALAIEFLPLIAGTIPKLIRSLLEILSLFIVVMIVAETFDGDQKTTIINFLSGIPILGGIIVGLALGFIATSIARGLTK